jgi:hypothetical protein
VSGSGVSLVCVGEVEKGLGDGLVVRARRLEHLQQTRVVRVNHLE